MGNRKTAYSKIHRLTPFWKGLYGKSGKARNTASSANCGGNLQRAERKSVMKILMTLLVLTGLVTGCANGWNSDASAVFPHSGLVGTQWKLKTDAYVIEYLDNRKVYIIIPCSQKFNSSFFPNGEWMYAEKDIGQKYGAIKAVGGLRAGEVLKIVRVVKNSHIEMGVSYHPMMVPEQSNRWTGDKELDGEFLYDDFEEQGVLNPDYAEKIE